MIGNDIIDLKVAAVQTNWQRRGWLQKIFITSELDMIKNAIDPNDMVWKLWSMKEAVYKAHQRRFSLSPRYNPQDFKCTDTSVVVDTYEYQTSSKKTEDYIHTTAYRNTYDIQHQVFIDNPAYKTVLRDYIASKIGVKTTEITFIKDQNGIPNVYVQNSDTKVLISLSSHGSFSAFAICFN